MSKSHQVRDRTSGPRYAYVPAGVLDSPEFNALPPTAMRVYLQIRRYAGCSQIMPRRATLARHARLFVKSGKNAGRPDVAQVRKAIRRLVEVGLVRTEARAGPSGRQTTNLYELMDPPSFLRYDDDNEAVFTGDPPGLFKTGALGLFRPGAGDCPDPGPVPDRGVGNDPPLRSEETQQTKDEKGTGRGRWSGRKAPAQGGLAAWANE